MRLHAVLVAVLLVASPAYARELTQEAELRVKAGLDEYEKGNYTRAIIEFEAAYSIDPDPDLLLAWAQAERLAGRCNVAVPRYKRYLESKPGTDGVQLATSGIDLCAASQPKDKILPVECTTTVERELPWYQNPVGGAVVVGIAGIAVGTGFLVAASGNRDLADSAITSDRFETLLDRATMQRRLGAVFMVFGVALVGGGISYHYLTRPMATPETVVSTDGRSIFVARTF